MKYQVLFSLKNNKKVFMNVVCWSCDWHFKGYWNKPHFLASQMYQIISEYLGYEKVCLLQVL